LREREREMYSGREASQRINILTRRLFK